MYRRIVTVFVLAFLASIRAWSQYDVAFSHYFVMEPSFNPAAVGKEAKINAVAAYNMSMVGFRHNPNTMFVSGDVPFYALKTYHGVGANIMSDNIGAFTHQRIALQYAVKKQLFGGMLSAGISRKSSMARNSILKTPTRHSPPLMSMAVRWIWALACTICTSAGMWARR